jgi:hypothetical protein
MEPIEYGGKYQCVPFTHFANRLRGLVHSRHDDTAEVLREFIGRVGFSFSREGR